MTPEALITQLRSTRDGDERRALTEAILELGYPWALELDAEHLALVRRRQPSRSWTWLLGGCWTVVSLSLGLWLANLGDLIEEAPARRLRAVDAPEAFVSRVARSVSSISPTTAERAMSRGTARKDSTSVEPLRRVEPFSSRGMRWASGRGDDSSSPGRT